MLALMVADTQVPIEKLIVIFTNLAFEQRKLMRDALIKANRRIASLH